MGGLLELRLSTQRLPQLSGTETLENALKQVAKPEEGFSVTIQSPLNQIVMKQTGQLHRDWSKP
jgi:hypothetical protein